MQDPTKQAVFNDDAVRVETGTRFPADTIGVNGTASLPDGLKPYYTKDGITIYHADCREVLPHLHGDCVITDPPYNCGKAYLAHDDNLSEEEYLAWLGFILEACARACPELIYFPGTANVLSAPRVLPANMKPHRMLGWHKKEFAGDRWHGGPAMCWEPIVWASRNEPPRFNRQFGKHGRDFLVVNSTRRDRFRKLHPCPKPLEVMVWLVSLFAPDGGLVLDPFAGTGTTLRACKDLGRRAIGIEIEESYCELAAKRLSQDVFAFEETAL